MFNGTEILHMLLIDKMVYTGCNFTLPWMDSTIEFKVEDMELAEDVKDASLEVKEVSKDEVDADNGTKALPGKHDVIGIISPVTRLEFTHVDSKYTFPSIAQHSDQISNISNQVNYFHEPIRQVWQHLDAFIFDIQSSKVPKPLTSVLIYGAPGTGKTQMIKSLSAYWNLPTVYIRGQEVMHTGMSQLM